MGKKRKAGSDGTPSAKKAKKANGDVDIAALFGTNDYEGVNVFDDSDGDDGGNYGGGRPADDGATMEEEEKEAPTASEEKTREMTLGLRAAPAAGEERLVVKSNQKKSDLYAPVTSTELTRLREAESLFKSNLFRLQIDEMLSSVRVDYTKTVAVEHAMRELKEVLESLKKKKMGDFTFAKPTRVEVVGSFLLRTVARPSLNVDLAVTMPQEMFQAKDFINGRYFKKRQAYLAHIAKKVQLHENFAKATFVSFCGDNAKPVIEIRPRGLQVDGKRVRTPFVVRVYAALPRGVFVESKLGPTRCNIRKNEATGEKLEAPTPHYNNAILEDMCLSEHLALLHAQFSNLQGGAALTEACMLLKTWRRQRWGSDPSCGVTGFFLSCILAHLTASRAISYHMSSYQAFRLVMEFLAKHDLATEGVVMAGEQEGGAAGVEGPDLGDFHGAFDVVFLDPAGTVNLAARIPLGTYHELRHEAALAAGYLADPVRDGFTALFMTPVDPLHKFDAFLCLKRVPGEDDISAFAGDAVHDQGPHKWLRTEIVRILGKALGSRATLIAPVPTPAEDGGWMFGIRVDHDAAVKLVDMGPPATSDEAEDFKAFWKDRAELRRFKDGAINFAVVWDAPAGSKGVVGLVATYALQVHCGVDPSLVSYLGIPDLALDKHGRRQIEGTLLSKDSGDTSKHGAAAMEAFDRLQMKLRALSGLPLAIDAVEGVAPVLRGTEAMPSAPHPMAGAPPNKSKKGSSAKILFTPALDAIVTFESSASWPDDLSAIAAVKTAFFLKLAERAEEELGVSCVTTSKYLDVAYEGFVFRLHIYHRRERLLLQKAKKSVEEFDRTYVERPRLAAVVKSFYQRFPAFSPSARLFKRWLAAHMFSGHVEEEGADLIAAAAFCLPRPYSVPSTPLAGFLRILDLVAKHPFDEAPLVVDLNGEMTPEQWAAVQERFVNERKDDRQAAPIDVCLIPATTCSTFTQHMPTRALRTRLIAYAQRTLQVVEQLMRSAMDPEVEVVDWLAAMRTPLHEFDVLIKLDPKALARGPLALPRQSSEKRDAVTSWLAVGKFKNLLEGSEMESLLVGFDPVECYLAELQNRFGHLCYFFHDRYGGDVVGVTWRRDPEEARSVKPGETVATIPLWEENKGKKKGAPSVAVDVVAVVADMEALGRGVVASVQPQAT